VAEAGVTAVDQIPESRSLERAPDERPEDSLGDLLEGSTLEVLQKVAIEPRPAFGHEQTAVGREPGEQRVFETDRRTAARADVVKTAHGRREPTMPPTATPARSGIYAR
jgi:hypothetical protein